MSSATGSVRLDLDGFVARVTVDNLARRNAVSLSMWRQLAAHFASIAANGNLRAVILRGAGDQAFVSGADIAEFDSNRGDPANVRVYDEAIETALVSIIECPVPVVASVHGPCMGGGIGLALSCDLRHAGAGASFRMPAAKLGLGYSTGNLRRIVQVVGPAQAAEMFYTARTYDASTAQRMGIVHAVHADSDLDTSVEQLTALIAQHAPLTIRAAKLAIRLAASPNDESLSQQAEAAARTCFDSTDYQEGRRAFGEKRPPRFQGR